MPSRTAERAGRLFVVSAPSGAGKTTLCRLLREAFPDLAYSVSATTRPPRKGEMDGVDYHFVDVETFRDGIAGGRWAEWAEVHGNYYGTPAAFLEDCRRKGIDVLMDIDVKGALQILSRFPDAVTVFIMPPSLEVLRERLTGRGSEPDANLAVRLDNAQWEMDQRHRYRHVIVNDRLETAAQELRRLVAAYRDPDTTAGGAEGMAP